MVKQLKSLIKRLTETMGNFADKFEENSQPPKPKSRKKTPKPNPELTNTDVTFGNSEASASKVVQPKIPTDETYFQVCSQSYQKKKNRVFVIRNYWKYLKSHSTDTVCAYLDELNKVIVLAFRGTVFTDIQDLVANKEIGFNRLSETRRFKADEETTNALLEDFPSESFFYYLTGHSLGQAIFLEMDKRKWKKML